jgi:hypothetical protein
MSVADAKRLELLEAEARARGIPLWQYEMMLAVPGNVVMDIWRDFRKGPTPPSSPIRPTDTQQEMRVTLYDQQQMMRKRRGWADPAPIEPPPGIKYIDAMCLVQDEIDRAERIRKLGELKPWRRF